MNVLLVRGLDFGIVVIVLLFCFNVSVFVTFYDCLDLMIVAVLVVYCVAVLVV